MDCWLGIGSVSFVSWPPLKNSYIEFPLCPLFLRIDEELVKSEASFSSFRDLSALVFSWNCGPSGPESLTGDPQNCNLLDDALHSVDSPTLSSLDSKKSLT